MTLHIGDQKASQTINPCAPRVLPRQRCSLRVVVFAKAFGRDVVGGWLLSEVHHN